MAPRIAFLGIGGMGKAITKRLVSDSNLDSPIILWNRTSSKAQVHSAEIGQSEVAATIQDAVSRADIVWSCLENEAAVRAVLEEALKHEIKGKLFVDSSSIPAPVSNELSARMHDGGAEYVGMPVFGDPSVAALGKLICVPCGSAPAIEKIKPYLQGVTAKAVIEMHDTKPGNASTLKLIGNILILLSMETIAEALVLSEKAGLGIEHMAQLIASLFPLPPHAIYREKMASGSYYNGEPAVDLRMAQNLASIVLKLADSAGASVPAYKAAVAHLAGAEEHGESSERDITSLYGAVRVESGLPFALQKQ